MKNVLYLDACVREESRTKKLAERFLSSIKCDEGFTVSRVDLPALDIYPLNRTRLEKKNLDEAAGDFADPRYDLAKQFAKADAIVIAAPYWDSSFPAKLKVYIENLCVEGITFGCDERGCFGTCKADKLVYITTRGGTYNGSPFEMGARYIEAMCDFFGIEDFRCICADGIDSFGIDVEKVMKDTMDEAEKAAAEL